MGAQRPPAGDGEPVGRRTVLAGAGAAAVGGLAGCLGGGEPTPTAAEPVTDLPPPVAGAADAAVTVAVYEDFSCPHCATFSLEVFPRLREAYLEPGTVRYEHHDFPIPVDDWSWPVASAARAVQDGAGDAAFFAYAKRLFESMDAYSLDTLAGLAEEVGAEPDAVRAAAAEEPYRPVVAADRRDGIDRGVEGTPTAFVGDTALVGPTFEELRTAIEAAR
ncbi:MAG: thioredoxin domain-containing protein [Halobacteriales archaeon]|nr:thioredoxin domain-containing protein [Halobacteriales archaeon]